MSERCKERVKKLFLELVSEELDRKATEEDLPWDFDKILEVYETMEFRRCDEVPKVKRALDILHGVNINAYEDVRKRCWVIDPNYALESVASHMPFPMEGKMISNVYVGGAYLEYMTENGVAESLLHEGLHIDFERNPAKYGVKDRDSYGMFKFFGLHEGKIDKAIEQTALAGYRGESNRAMSEVWAKRKKRLWIEEPILRIHTCMTGVPEERFYVLEEPQSRNPGSNPAAREPPKNSKEFMPFGACPKCGYPLASEITAEGKTRIFCERCGWEKPGKHEELPRSLEALAKAALKPAKHEEMRRWRLENKGESNPGEAEPLIPYWVLPAAFTLILVGAAFAGWVASQLEGEA